MLRARTNENMRRWSRPQAWETAQLMGYRSEATQNGRERRCDHKTELEPPISEDSASALMQEEIHGY